MKNLVKPLVETSATPTDETDGIVYTSTEYLKSIKYPNRLNDIAVVGKLQRWHRSFLLRPAYGGRFLFLIYPSKNIIQETILTFDLNLANFNSAPYLLNITIPESMRIFDKWEWRVYKTAGINEEEDSFEEQDALKISDGMLTGNSAFHFAKHAADNKFYSKLIYETRPTIAGEIIFEEEKDYENAKIAVWSCHQPYTSENGKAIVKPESEKILKWYKTILEKISPHMIWMLGDSVYSDGTGALNFVEQVYDQKGWEDNWALRKDLLSLYRLNYRYHWGFKSMQEVMRKFPHLGMWDDHEIRDGYGSEEGDFQESNIAIKQIASQAAEEYLFQYSPKLRSESTKNSAVDNHQAYINNPVAAFIFDGRNSRNYGENMPVPSDVPIAASSLAGAISGGILGFGVGAIPGAIIGGTVGGIGGAGAGTKLANEIIEIYRWHNPGEVVSDLQLKDFERFCNHIKGQPKVKYLLTGNSVPFIYILDFVESIASESALAGSEFAGEIRDDIRDSWHSPANRRQLKKLVNIMQDLHNARDDIEFVNISGDIHISNAFLFQPDGFRKPLFQVTSSALTNNPPSSGKESFLNLISVDGAIGYNARSKDFGKMERLWHVGQNQNFLTVNAKRNLIEFHLHVYNAEDTSSQGNDKILTIKPNQGYFLT